MTKYTPFPEAWYTLLHRSGTVLLQTSRFDANNYRSLLFVNPFEILTTKSLDEVTGVFARVEAALRQGRYVAGYVSYDCGALAEPVEANVVSATPLVWFGVFDQPYVFDHRSGDWIGAVPPAERITPESWNGAVLRPLELLMTPAEHAAKVAAIHDYIRAGDTYQVNLTAKLPLECAASAAAVFVQLSSQQRVAYSAFIADDERSILSFSPELFYRVEGGQITTRPMKGTAARGRTREEDTRISDWLAHDPKNRSENIMIVDLLRNDLGRVCEFGTVSVDEIFHTEKYETVWQMTSTVRGKLRADDSQIEVFKHLFPCGSVTGAPKLRTMEIIRELEQQPRDVYTGAIGYFAPEGNAVFNVAIRTLVLKDGRGEMGVGGGIVIDSVADQEYQECLVKADFLTQGAEEFQLIESLLWDRQYRLLPYHLERLQDSAEYFDFDFDRETIIGALASHAETLVAGTPFKVRLQLDRSGVTTIESTAMGPTPPTGRVMLARERTCSADRFLFHKSTNRQQYDRLFQETVRLGYDDVLFMNERDEITEGAISNVFIEVGARWYTPPISCGLLAGVARRQILEANPAASEKVLRLEDLQAADAIYICNAVRGIRKVTLEAKSAVAVR